MTRHLDRLVDAWLYGGILPTWAAWAALCALVTAAMRAHQRITRSKP